MLTNFNFKKLLKSFDTNKESGSTAHNDIYFLQNSFTPYPIDNRLAVPIVYGIAVLYGGAANPLEVKLLFH